MSEGESAAKSESSRRLPLGIWIAIGGAALLSLGVFLFGLLATLVVPNVLQKYAVTSCGKAKVDITTIASALKEYAIANGGKYPNSLEELVTPDVNGHTYLDTNRIPKDPWGREYLYDPPGAVQPVPRIYSYGKDGRAGGSGDDADLDNFTIRDERGGR